MVVDLFALEKNPRSSASLAQLNQEPNRRAVDDLWWWPAHASFRDPVPAACFQTNARACLRALAPGRPFVRVFPAVPYPGDRDRLFGCFAAPLLHAVFAAAHLQDLCPIAHR